MKAVPVLAAFICLVFLFPAAVSGQKDVKKYREEAESVRKQIWAWDRPEFAVRNIPSEYASFSSVVIARHQEISVESKSWAKLSIIELGAYRELLVTEIFREAVKINDRAAVSRFSEMEFVQFEKSRSITMDESATTYIGFRIFKQNGEVKEINRDDIVLISKGKDQQNAKLAIPDLQPGDIIDYFIAKSRRTEQLKNSTIENYTFNFYDEQPVMHYSVTGTFGNKCAIEYRVYNNAPAFKQTRSEGGDIVLSVERKNIPPHLESSLWTSRFRQLPIIRMNIDLGAKGVEARKNNARKPGEVYANQTADEFIEDRIDNLAMWKKALFISYPVHGPHQDYYKALLKKAKKMNKDSLIAELFYVYRFDKLLRAYPVDGIQSIVKRGEGDFARDLKYKITVSTGLKSKGVDNKYVIVTAYDSPRLNEIMHMFDTDIVVIAEGEKTNFLGIRDIFTPAFYIPYEFEGAIAAITVDTKGVDEHKMKNFDKGTINIPKSKAGQNLRNEFLNITINPQTSNLNISRRTQLKGHYKSEIQRQLILFEDYYDSERKLFGVEKSLIGRLLGVSSTRQFGEELITAFKNERGKQQAAFTEEARDWFEQEVIELQDHKVENFGVRHTSPDFVYSSNFKMGGVLKKAGNNLILEIGKLQGVPLKVSPEQRKRTIDIYMPFARSINSEIILQIPEGYTVEGVEALNKKVENETGFFICEASMDGQKLKVSVKKSYNNAFEPAANWEKMLTFLDAANEWYDAKLLLKKK